MQTLAQRTTRRRRAVWVSHSHIVERLESVVCAMLSAMKKDVFVAEGITYHFFLNPLLYIFYIKLK